MADALDDLKKARVYLDREITQRERPPRGFIELDVMGALGLGLGIAIAVVGVCATFGHILSERDRAKEATAAAELRADTCADLVGALVVAGENLRRSVDLHLAIDEDACACFIPEPIEVRR